MTKKTFALVLDALDISACVKVFGDGREDHQKAIDAAKQELTRIQTQDRNTEEDREMKFPGINAQRNADGTLSKHAWPGGYPCFALMGDGDVLCIDCANTEESVSETAHDPGWRIEAIDCNWEDPDLYCAHCNKRIESAYAEDGNK